MPKRKKRKIKPQFKAGSHVRVKSGTAHPEYPDIPLGGWAGEVLCVETRRSPTYWVEWTKETLGSAHPVYFKRCKRDDLDAEETLLPEASLEPDPGGPLAIEQPTSLITRPLSPDNFQDRLRIIFGLTSDDAVPTAGEETLQRYCDYLAARLSFPFDAFWLDNDDMPEVTVLGMREPSPIDESQGIMVRVRSAEQEADCPLAELEVDEDAPNRDVLEDYADWAWSDLSMDGDDDGSEDEEARAYADDESDDEGEIDTEDDMEPELDEDEVGTIDIGRSDEPEPADRLPPVPRLRKQETVGRNDPCPCGSGKKYKKCCMNKQDMDEPVAKGPLAGGAPRPLAHLSNLPATPDKTAYQVKVTLLRTDPPIWRRFQVCDCTLETLHGILQSVMGWTNDHLYGFDAGKQHYTDPEGARDAIFSHKGTDTTTISRLVRKGVKSFTYTYDFGDSWEHEILVEETLAPEQQADYPVCIAGERACPPEDCGGVWGYADLLEALESPEDEENQERLEWVGDFDPDEFDLAEVNEHLKWAKRP